MLKCMKAHWKRAISGLLALVMTAGMLPASAFAADTSDVSNPYAPTGDFELNVAGATAWNGAGQPLTVYRTEGGTTQATTVPSAAPFALLEDKGGDRIKIGYVVVAGRAAPWTAPAGWTKAVSWSTCLM